MKRRNLSGGREEVRESAKQEPVGRAFQAEDITGAKALGWTLAGQVGEQSGGQAIGPKRIQVRDEVMEVLICRAL